MEDGPLQNGGQLFRVVVRVGETIHPFGDETGGAGVFRHDGGFSEDEALGDEGGHRVVAGGADEAGALLHQILDLIPAEPLAVEDVGRVFGGQGADGVHHLLVGSFAHEEEGCFFPHGVGQQADSLAEDVLPLPALERADRGEEGLVGGVAQVAAGEILSGIVRQAVDEGADVELGADRVHGGGSVFADRVELHIGRNVLGDLVRDVGVARKGIVEPPEHRHRRVAQGADNAGLDHGVGQHEVGAERQSPEGVRGGAARAGDDGGSGIHEELERAGIVRAEDHDLIAHAAEHRHGADQHDGGTGHIQHMAHDEGPLAGGGIGILGADVPLVVEQGLRDADRSLAELRGQSQQLRDAFGVPRGGAAAGQQAAADESELVLGQMPMALVEGRLPRKAEDRIADGVVRAVPQGLGKIGQGGGEAGNVLADEEHTGHRVGQLSGQMVHQTEFAVELVLQSLRQNAAAQRRIDEQIGALGVGVGLLCQLFPLQGSVTVVHARPSRLSGGTAPAGGAGAVSASSCCCSGRLPAKFRRPDGGLPPRRSSGAVR